MILEHIKQNLPKSDCEIVVGVSGGPDSLCLVDILVHLAYPVVVAHFNHCLRPEAWEEAQKVEGMAVSLGVPFVSGEKNVIQYAQDHSLSIEEAARLLRYQFLFGIAENRKAEAVAVGHNANDQAETILMNILRGSGLAGLTGMSSSSLPNPWSKSVALVRPLLSVWRKDILTYCQERGLSPLYDPSNAETTFFRNRVRHDLLPLLEEYRPNIQRRLCQMANILSGDQEALEQRVDYLWKDFLVEHTSDYLAFEVGNFLNLPKGMQRRLIRRGFQHLRPDFTDLSFEVVEQARCFIEHPSRSKAADLAGWVRITIIDEWIYLATQEAHIPLHTWPQIPDKTSRLELPIPGEVHLTAGWRIQAKYVENGTSYAQALKNANPFQVWLDARGMDAPLILRGKCPGERIAPLGMDGRSMKVADLMVNEKIPQQARPKWPLVISQGEVIWVPGYRLAHKARITEHTEKVLSLSLYHD